MKRIFFDMDGVLAEYRENCSEADMKKKGYFSSLMPETNMVNALNRLAENSEELGISVCVLTKVYPSDFKYSISEKLEWRDEYLPLLLDSEFIMVNGEKEEKSEAIKSLTDVDIDEDCFLIDDYNYNLFEWRGKGGSTIKYVNGINDKNKSFIGNRLSYEMSEDEIYSSILEMVGGANTPTKTAA